MLSIFPPILNAFINWVSPRLVSDGGKPGLSLHFRTKENTEYTDISWVAEGHSCPQRRIGEIACLTWFLEFGIWSLMKLGVFTIGDRAWYSVGVLPQSWAVVLYPSAGLSPTEC